MSARHPRPGSRQEPGREESPQALLLALGYTVTHRIAESDRGQVLAASDPAGLPVAIRVLPPGRLNGTPGASFQRESQAGLRLSHPHIVRSIATGERGGMRYLVMELVDGPSLAERVRSQGPLSEREAVVLLSQLAQALGYAARLGVANHRLAPSDVLLGPARLGVREPFCAKLSNCGLAHLGQAPRPSSTPAATLATPSADDRHALATTICWSLTPVRASADQHRPSSSISTMRLPGISAEAMQLLGRMLLSQGVPWAEIVDGARRLVSLPAAAPG